MFKKGDLMIYSGHGICKVVDITERTINDATKEYYILQPVENNQQLTISIPVDNSSGSMHQLMDKDEAKEILESFREEGVKWINKPQVRAQKYTDLVNSGDRFEIAKVAKTLLVKKKEVEEAGRKFYEHDRKLLERIETTLYKELAIVLEKSDDEIIDKIYSII